MKLNIIYKIIIGAAIVTTCLTSCNYLDVVPVEQATLDDAYKKPELTLAYLYSCYSGLKNGIRWTTTTKMLHPPTNMFFHPTGTEMPIIYRPTNAHQLPAAVGPGVIADMTLSVHATYF